MEELQKELQACKEQLETVTRDQMNATRLLIRRDLELSRANEQLKKLDVAKSEFISVAAHQLRTPLSSIKWILSMLSTNQFKDDGERAEFIGKAIESSDRLISLVNDLLEVDHIQSGKDDFVFDAVDVGTIMTSVVLEVQPLAMKRGIVCDVKGQGECVVRGDKNKLRAVFQNLVENAIKYTPEHGKVSIDIESNEKSVELHVADSGIGIPKDQADNIFTKFFRASNALRANTVGTGLGLFIAREIISRHGGTIDFKSEEGKGTVFSVVLPKIGV